MNVAALSAPYSFAGGAFPGSGGDCAATLAASASCTMVVTYAPTGTGTQTDTISVTFNDGVTASQTSTRGLTGTGAAPAAITISDGATYNFGTIANGGSADKSFTVTNTGGVSATALSGTGLSAPYSFKGGSYPGAGGNCSSTLAASATCTVVVTFAPTVAGVQNATMNLTFNNGVAAGQSSTRALTGTGVAPAVLDITDAPLYDFGAVVATGSADKTLTITNSGQLAASSIVGSGLSAPFSFKGGSYPGIGGTCGATLTGSASCTVVVTFNPSVTGSYSATMNLAYFDGAANQNSPRDLQGVGATAANITISDVGFSFGTVANGSSQDKTFTLTNGGGVQATAMSGSGLSAPYTFKGGAYPGTGGNCGTTLNAAATCTIVVNYNPSTIATHNATITVGYTDGLAVQSATRAITGTAVAPAVLTISDGATYDFGTLATGATGEKTFTITNTGTFTASSMNGSGLSAPFAFKGGSYPGIGGTCSATLNGGGTTCTVVATYSPTGTGTQNGTMQISYSNGASGQTSSRNVTGTGAAPALLTISDAGWTYGTVANGSSNDKTFTVTNTGGVPATSMAGGGLSVPYSFKGGSYPGTGGTCSGSLAGSSTHVRSWSPSTQPRVELSPTRLKLITWMASAPSKRPVGSPALRRHRLRSPLVMALLMTTAMWRMAGQPRRLSPSPTAADLPR